jgi:hypothetical protein
LLFLQGDMVEVSSMERAGNHWGSGGSRIERVASR